MRGIWFILILMSTVRTFSAAEESKPLDLSPWPAQRKTGPGQLVIETSFAVGLQENADPRLRHTVDIFLNDLRRHTGSLELDFGITNDSSKAQLGVTSEYPSKEVQEMVEDESYTLTVTPIGAHLQGEIGR